MRGGSYITELEFYKFCNQQELDWRSGKLIMWIEPEDLKELSQLLGDNYLCEEGLNINLRNGGTLALELNEICKDFNIEPEDIYSKES